MGEATTELPVRDTAVLVVGAGPTGLMAALVLRRRGVDVIVVDGKSGPTRESRALAVQARTMEIYDQLGLAERVLQRREAVRHFSVGTDRGAVPGRVEVADLQAGGTPFPGLHVFEQSDNERLLADALAEAGGGVDWSTELVSLTAEDDGVEALVRGPEGLTRIRARWCVAADGARSLVRRLLDVPFDGVTDAASFWVADVSGLSGLPGSTVSVRFSDRRLMLSFPMRGAGHFRLIGMTDLAEPTAETVLPQVIGEFRLSGGETEWFSHYRVHHRVAARFAQGPVFLAGDAAHVHSPLGGQGMNTGLQDAHNLALKLADVLDGRADPATLERYQEERRPVAETLVRVTDRAFGIVARPSPVVGTLRRLIIPRFFLLLGRVARGPVGPRIAGYLGQYRIRYGTRDADDPAVGVRLRPTEANRSALRGLCWQLHGYGTGPIDRPGGVPDWVEGVLSFPADDQLRADRVYLVRPDGFVAGAVPVREGRVDDRAVQHLTNRVWGRA